MAAEVRTVSVAIAIATHRRPERLENLLEAIHELELSDGERALDIRLAVADNDPAGSAGSVVQSWIDRGVDISYAVEPIEGYSYGRNASVSLSDRDADYIAFVDDDDRPDRDWLINMIAAIELHGADGGSGPQLAADVGDAEWIRWLEDRDRSRTGTPVEYAHSNNLVVAMAHVEDQPFDHRFRRTGGEDVDWTMRLTQAGRKLIWVDDAIVRSELTLEERQLRSRATQRFKGSRNYARAMRNSGDYELSDGLLSVVRVGQGCVMAAAGTAGRRPEWQCRGTLLAAGGVGVLAGLTNLGANRAWRSDSAG